MFSRLLGNKDKTVNIKQNPPDLGVYERGRFGSMSRRTIQPMA
jgi:hypothetical protein